MAITSTYPIIVPKLTDLIVGTQTYTAEDPVLNNPTRNFTVQSIADLVSSPGTANTIAMFSTSGLTDSLITQAGSSITVAGDIKASGAIIDSGTTTLANLTLKSLNSGYGGGGVIDIMGGPQDFVRYETNVKLGGGTTVASQVYDMNGDGWTWDGNMQTGVNTGTSYNFKSGGSSQMVIFNNNVGIGITNPSAPLHVVGSTLINGSLYFGDNTTTDPSIFNYANSLHLYAAAGNQIDLGGGIGNRQNNVRIGNGSLHISSGLTALGNTILGDDDTTTVTIESILNLQGPIKDSAGNLGSNGQVLISTANSSVFWGATSGTGTVTSVDLSTNISAFTVAANPITSAGTITLNLNGGTAGQFLRQDGNWATPAGGGGAVDSVNGATGVVSLDTGDITENTNLYYTEARVSANTDVAANTAKDGITTVQATDITNSVKNDTDTYTSTPPVTKIITLTQAEYNAIVSGGTPNVNTLYIII